MNTEALDVGYTDEELESGIAVGERAAFVRLDARRLARAALRLMGQRNALIREVEDWWSDGEPCGKQLRRILDRHRGSQ
jgi:hypothetical protein